MRSVTTKKAKRFRSLRLRVGAFERVNPRSGIISGEIATLRAGSLHYWVTRAVNNRDFHEGATRRQNLNICRRLYSYSLSPRLGFAGRLFNQFVDVLAPTFHRIIPRACHRFSFQIWLRYFLRGPSARKKIKASPPRSSSLSSLSFLSCSS